MCNYTVGLVGFISLEAAERYAAMNGGVVKDLYGNPVIDWQPPEEMEDA